MNITPVIMQMQTITKQARVAIIGAGISGLALAISLKQKGFEQVQVYEQDLEAGSRRQGYGLTILQGKRVLRALGVLQQAKELNSPTKAHYFFNQKGKFLDFYGTMFWDGEDQSKRWNDKGLSMHIPRQQLRTLLLNRFTSLSASANCVVWNHKLSALPALPTLPTLPLALAFQNTTKTHQTDLVIGCDGIYSSLRKLAMQNDLPLNYLGVMVVLGICGSSHSLNKERIFQTSNGEGRFYSMPFASKDPLKNAMWQFSIPVPEHEAIQYQNSPDKMKRFLLNYCKDWHQPIPTLIASTELNNLMTLPAYDRDPKPSFFQDDRILLMGDACHPMSPFKSQGANQALLDAFSLSDLLLKHSDMATIASKFNEEKFQRTSKKVMQSRERVFSYHRKESVTQMSYLNPRIDGELVKLLNEEGEGEGEGEGLKGDEDLEGRIITIMKEHHYIPS